MHSGILWSIGLNSCWSNIFLHRPLMLYGLEPVICKWAVNAFFSSRMILITSSTPSFLRLYTNPYLICAIIHQSLCLPFLLEVILVFLNMVLSQQNTSGNTPNSCNKIIIVCVKCVSKICALFVHYAPFVSLK